MKKWVVWWSVLSALILCMSQISFADTSGISRNMVDEYKSRLFLDAKLKREYIEWQIEQKPDRRFYTEESLREYDHIVQTANVALKDSTTTLPMLNTISFQLQEAKGDLVEQNVDLDSRSSRDTLMRLVAYARTLDFRKIKNSQARDELIRCIRETEQYFLKDSMTELEVQGQFLKMIRALNRTVDYMKEEDTLDYHRLITNLRRVEKLEFEKLSKESLHSIYEAYLMALSYYKIDSQEVLNREEKKFSRLIDNLAYMKKVESISTMKTTQAIGLGSVFLVLFGFFWIRRNHRTKGL